jgi:glycosyltransferase involved in cell wall biosynthesis
MVIGGPAVAISETIRQLNGEFSFFLVTGDPLPDEMDASVLLEQIPGLELIRLQGMKRAPGLLRDIRAYFKLKRIFRRIQPDVVHTHGAKPGLLGRLAAHSMKVPIILHTYHGHIFHSYFNRFVSAWVVRAERWLAKKSTAIIAISDHLRNELSEKYHIAPASKIYTIPLLLNLAVFQDPGGLKRSRFRSAYQLQQDEVAVGIIGRLTKVKNMQLFARVVEMLHQRAVVRYRFFIIGDGAEKKMLRQHFTQAGIEHTDFTEKPVKATVTFTSWLRNTDEVMNGLDIVCLTSLNEGTPVSLIEAQAASKPVVTTNAGSISDMIIENEGGFLTGISDADTFARRVETLALNEPLRVKMGQAGCGRISELYNMHRAKELSRLSYQSGFLPNNAHASA